MQRIAAMSDLSSISTEELLRDRQESHNDLLICLYAKVIGVDPSETKTNIDDRMDGNIRIIDTISDELRSRGIDWI